MNIFNIRPTIIYIFTLAYLCSGCEVVVESDRLEAKGGKLVINSLIAPHIQDIAVEVSLSQSILDNMNYSSSVADIVTTADVTISDSQNTVSLFYDATIRKYTTDINNMPIIAGKTYYLEVSHNGITATSECTVPYPVTNFWVEEKYSNHDSKINIYWEDRPLEQNYYLVDAILTFGMDGRYYFDEDRLTSDTNKDGLTLSASGSTYTNISTRQVTVLMTSMDENNYEYLNRLSNYEGDNPFSEPVPLFSNINGGIGIFAGFNLTERTFVFN